MKKLAAPAKFQLTKSVVARFAKSGGAGRPFSSSILNTVSSVI